MQVTTQRPFLRRIVSGGQTGVDRAALEVAVAARIEYGGWCPAGGWAEDHPEPPGVLAAYPCLRPTDSADPAVRTRRNVADSDATLVLLPGGSVRSPGTDRTRAAAAELGRPHLVATTSDVEAVRAWLTGLPGRPGGLTLNVAGPRESEAPGARAAARALLEAVLSDAAG